MISLWQGIANTWDCDEMGHMNVRVYVEKAMEGLGTLAHAIDMPHAFRPSMPSTLLPAEQHIRFMHEIRPGHPVSMHGCVLEAGECDATIYQEIQHADGTPSAAIRTHIKHVEAKSGQSFPWSARTREKLEALKDTPPKETAPRSLMPFGPALPSEETTLSRAEALGVHPIGSGAVPPQHCDLNGRMQAQWFMGRVSDSVPNLMRAWRETVAAAAGGVEQGAAVLEYRLVYRRWPRAGDLFQIRTGLARIEEKFHSLVHWMLDPVTGEAWMTSEAIAVTFDLGTRKIIPTSPEKMKDLEALAPKGLAV